MAVAKIMRCVGVGRVQGRGSRAPTSYFVFFILLKIMLVVPTGLYNTDSSTDIKRWFTTSRV